MSARYRGAFLLAATLALPAGAAAQGNNGPSPEVREWIEEIQQIQARLAPVQDQAMQDPGLQQERQQVADAVKQAMITADPGIAQRMARLEAIVGEAQKAQETGDGERLAALVAEARGIQEPLARAQAAALDRPEIEARVTAFRGRLRARMVQIEPSSEALLNRLEALDRQVRDALRGG